jgi:hypothetical protein
MWHSDSNAKDDWTVPRAKRQHSRIRIGLLAPLGAVIVVVLLWACVVGGIYIFLYRS